MRAVPTEEDDDDEHDDEDGGGGGGGGGDDDDDDNDDEEEDDDEAAKMAVVAKEAEGEDEEKATRRKGSEKKKEKGKKASEEASKEAPKEEERDKMKGKKAKKAKETEVALKPPAEGDLLGMSDLTSEPAAAASSVVSGAAAGGTAAGDTAAGGTAAGGTAAGGTAAGGAAGGPKVYVAMPGGAIHTMGKVDLSRVSKAVDVAPLLARTLLTQLRAQADAPATTVALASELAGSVAADPACVAQRFPLEYLASLKAAPLPLDASTDMSALRKVKAIKAVLRPAAV